MPTTTMARWWSKVTSPTPWRTGTITAPPSVDTRLASNSVWRSGRAAAKSIACHHRKRSGRHHSPLDLAWLACIGALLLTAGLLSLLFDTLRRRRHNQPLVEPDPPTTLLNESEG